MGYRSQFSVPESAGHCTVHLFLQIKGRFWFDDIRLTDLDNGRDPLANGSFEQWPDPAAAPPGWTAAKRWGEVPCTKVLGNSGAAARRRV